MATRTPIRHRDLILWPVDGGPGVALFVRSAGDLDTDVARVMVDARDRLRIEGDLGFEDLPERVALNGQALTGGEGRILDFGTRSLRRFDLHQFDSVLNFDPSYEIYEWTITSQGRYAVVSTHRGSFEWPVLDLDNGEVSHTIGGVSHQRPMLAISDDGLTMAVAIHDQIHRLPSLLGPVGQGVRLKSDNSGSYVTHLRFGSSGELVVTWIQRQSGGLFDSSDTAESVFHKLADAQRNMDSRQFIESTIATPAGAFVLTMDLERPAVTAEARFPDHIGDAITAGDWAVARTGRELVGERLSPTEWDLYPPREPGEKLWL